MIHSAKRRLVGRSVLLASATTIAWAGLAAPSFAQASSAGQVEEVVVTAQRREERLQDVPVAITAVTAARLESAGIKGTEGLTEATPGLNMTRLRASSSPFMRGVGTTSSNASYETPTAIYIDGVYAPAMPGGFFSFNNIDRVEVLKGPQGTLFGRNAVGGVIQIITKDPSHTPSAKVSLTYGNYETVGGSFYGTAGLTDNIAADLALNYSNQSKGTGINTVTGAEVNWQREFNARTKILGDFGSTRITAALDYSKNNSAYGLSGKPFPGTRFSSGAVPVPGFYDVALSIDPYSMAEQFGGSLNIRQELGFADLVSISGFRKVRNFYKLPGWNPVNTADAPISEFNNMWSQELQLQSSGDGAFEWTLGAYAFQMKSAFDPLRLTGPTQAAFGGYSDRYSYIDTESLAAFGQASWNLTDATRLTAGLRYTADKQGIEGFNLNANGTRVVTRTPVSDRWNKLTWRLAIDHKLSPDVLIYASYNRGFKSGAYSSSAPANPPVNPETLDAFEVGQKADLFDRTLRLNSAIFYYNYKDIQLNQLAGSPPVSRLLNAARARMYGAEVEAEFVPTENLSLRAAVSYLNSRYKSFPNGPVFTSRPTGGNIAGVGDNSGKIPPYSPKWTLNLSSVYTIPLEAGDVTLSASMFHSDGYFFVPNDRFGQSPYTLVNGAISWSPGNRGARIEIWGKNLGNEKWWAFAQESPTGDIVVSAMPRTYGVTLSYEF